MSEMSVQVVRRAPLRRYRGVRPGEATMRQLAGRLGGVMVIGRRGQLTSDFQYSF